MVLLPLLLLPSLLGLLSLAESAILVPLVLLPLT